MNIKKSGWTEFASKKTCNLSWQLFTDTRSLVIIQAMNGEYLKQWRLKKGWDLKTAAKQFGLPVSKLRQIEDMHQLSPLDDRLVKVLIVGIAAIRIYEGTIERQKIIVDGMDLN